MDMNIIKNIVEKVPTRTVTSDIKNDYDPRPESDRDTILTKLMYVKSGSFEDVRKVEHMMTLYDEDYSNYANNACVLFELRKGNAPEELPLRD